MKTIPNTALAVPTILLCLIATTWAQSPTPTPTPSANVTTFASGLIFPRGLKFGPDGNLFVAEAGTGGNLTTVGQCQQVPPPLGPQKGGFTSRVSKITPAGVRTTVVDNLPSTIDALAGDAIGISDVAFIGDTLYALSSGAGCGSGIAGTSNGLVRVNADGTTTQIADLSAYIMSHPAAAPPTDDFTPDGVWYNMTAARGDFWVVESNQGMLVKITSAGAISRVVDFSATEGHWVPTALAYDGDFYVANLGVFPTVNGASKILKVTPDGTVTTFATNLTAVLALAFDALHRLYVLETSTDNDFPTEGAGKILRLDNSGNAAVIATGLSYPTAMTFGPDGNLYVSHRGYTPPNMGEIVKVNLQPSAASELANISARSLVQTGDNILIAGFIVRGSNATHKVLLRALGPSLPGRISNRLADPTLSLHDGNGNTLATNDDWKDDATQASAINATGIPPQNDRESAILADLPSGTFTAIVTGKNNSVGVALVEVYNLSN